eukprot:GHVH01014437.1.p2 GENE.GHVH01014437.1~~GHVH01014437.1.p2  ORF type:complete len:119 (+),score=3.93 GHVH01014437.1:601-957(+)
MHLSNPLFVIPPGLQQYAKADGELDRLSALQTRLLDGLRLAEFPAPPSAPISPRHTFRVGDVVLFPRSPFERSRDSPPALGEPVSSKYLPSWSLPSRVVKVSKTTMLVHEVGRIIWII